MSAGVAYGYVPELAGTEQLRKFDEILFHPSGPFPLEAAWRAIDSTLAGLRKTDSQMLIVEDHPAGFGTMADDVSQDRTILVGKTLLRWVPFHEGDTREIADFIGNLRQGDNAFLLTGVDGFRPMEEISRDRLAKLSRSVVAVLVGAYDAVSYVVWYRGEAIPH